MTETSPTSVSENLAVQAESDHRLISANRVQGTALYDTAGSRLGTVEDVMLDKLSGQVAFAILSMGGFLGIGDRHHPLPWASLKYDTRLGGYVVDATREHLAAAPHYPSGERPDLAGAEGRRVHDHYKQRPIYLEWT